MVRLRFTLMGLPRQATAGLESQSRLENGLCREYADVLVKHLSPQHCHLMAEFSLTLASYAMPELAASPIPS